MFRKRMTKNDMISYLGCGIHTGLRKAASSKEAYVAWNAISQMPDGEWKAVLEFAFQQVQRVVWKKGGK